MAGKQSVAQDNSRLVWRLLVQRVQGHGGVASDGARQLERLLDSGAVEEQYVGSIVTATVLHS